MLAGRRLRWAPEWDCSDGRLVFDAAAGDYWVLSPLATLVVRAAEGEPVDLPLADPELDATLTQLRKVGLLA